MSREMILKGRVQIGQTNTYQVIEKGGQPKMVSFIDKKGDVLSGSYSHLHIAAASDDYLHLEFTRHKVYVRGKHLAKVSRAMADHRLVYLAETPPREHGLLEPTVYKITFVMTGRPEELGEYLAAATS